MIFEKRLKRKLTNLWQGLDSTTERYLGPPRELRPLAPRKSANPADLPLYRQPVAADWSLRLLKEIEWHRFEHLVAAYERELGCDAEVTDFGPDGGIDIRVFEKEGRIPKRIIQCKAFNNQFVDVKLVRELMGVMAHEKASQGAFYTTSEFTPPALELGRSHLDIDLVDGRTFLYRISRLPPEAQARLLAIATEGDYTTPTCASCGVKMILKTASKGRREGSSFWGCRSYPRCQQIINISKA
ncbi:MAG TPA: restriction endonuclease [Lacunisphaera sp.]|nr:restriction endonuclease [Lacunisphaera sp.]